MHFAKTLLALLPLASAAVVPAPAKDDGLFLNNIIFVPPTNYTDPRVLYPRTTELADGTLLATWENYSPEPPPVYFPIYKSVDGGKHWHEISRVQDQVYGYGLRYQPFLYQLPEAIGAFPAGTVLASGSAIPTNLSSTNIELYASHDSGYTWKFVSHIAHGGVAIPDNDKQPVWEPFLMVYGGELIAYYSDQRQNATHGQILVHQTSKDLKNWGPVVVDVEYLPITARPGMTTVTKLPNGKYIMTYEYGGGPGNNGSYWFPVYYRINQDPRRFNDSEGVPIKIGNYQPTSSPYVTWSREGGCNGTIIVSSGSSPDIFTNQALGDSGAWKRWSTPQPTAYTRHIRVFRENQDHLLIMGAGVLPPSTTNNVSLSVVSLSQTMGK